MLACAACGAPRGNNELSGTDPGSTGTATIDATGPGTTTPTITGGAPTEGTTAVTTTADATTADATAADATTADATAADATTADATAADATAGDTTAADSTAGTTGTGTTGGEPGFVHVATWGDDLAAGTIDDPLRTVQAGIALAVQAMLPEVHVAAGLYPEDVALAPNVAVFGGYDGSFLTRDPDAYPTLLEGQPGGALGAVRCEDIVNGMPGSTVFDGFTIRGADATVPGESTYAVYIRGCDGTLTIANNTVEGGDGEAGEAGADATPVANGAPGFAGKDAFDIHETYGMSGHNCPPNLSSPGGAGGTNLCGGVATHGGAGGARRCPGWDDNAAETLWPSASEYGVAGKNGAAGGPAGRDVFQQIYNCVGFAVYGLTDGGDGANGVPGADGIGGAGCVQSSATVSVGQWILSGGTAGSAGSHGGGGGGGGSGGGAWVDLSCAAKGFGADNIGASGGGGGAGGCGGTAGSGGGSGGASFAVFVTFDVVPSTLPAITGNTLKPGRGGTGGAGGAGFTGGAVGAGGPGGTGVDAYLDATPAFPTFPAGRGGDGGHGGDGGGGGGGCGGPVYGVFAWNTGGLDVSPWSLENSFAGGTGGAGGDGGASPGKWGQDGEPGAVANTNF